MSTVTQPSRPGSRHPERIELPANLAAVESEIAQYDEQILVIARGMVQAELARRAGYSDDRGRALTTTRAALMVVLDDADAACRRATGRPLRTTSQYTAFKAVGAPAVSTIYRHFGSFCRALAAAGLLHVPPPEAEMTVSAASAHPERPTKAQSVAAVAAVMEEIHGLDPSVEAYERGREARRLDLPSYQQIVRALCGKGSKHGGWEKAKRMARDLIPQTPHDYPRASRRLARARTRGTG